MSITMPFVSCIVPAHNEEKTLPRTIENLLAQDYPRERMEIVVALNGCTDNSAEIARAYPVTLTQSNAKGMSFGKNLGARAAKGDFLLFIDADTTLPPHGIRTIMSHAMRHQDAALTVSGKPDRGGLVVIICFWIMNWYTRLKKIHSLGGVIGLSRQMFDRITGFDEELPQGTSTDVIQRARQAGASYVNVHTIKATTSIRRFEKTGIIRQMLSWRKNHRLMEKNKHEKVAVRHYEDFR